MLRKFFFLAVLVLLPSLTALAQETPQWEIFGGYSYLRAGLGPTSPLSPSPSFSQLIGFSHINTNGWHASVTENVNKWFGATIEVSGHYKRPLSIDLTPFGFPGQTLNINTSAYIAGGGPQFSYHRIEKVSPFAHVLFGAFHARANLPTTDVKISDTTWAITLGGGIDVRLSRHLAIRGQADYIRSHFSDLAQKHVRASGGLVYRIGSR